MNTAQADHDWPAPVEVLNPSGASDIVLLCEHASNHIPAEYAGLGLSAHDRQRHIAWDIGAAEVTRRLSGLLGATAYLAGYSRLLIDLNRPLDVPGSIATRSEDTDIASNTNLSIDEVERRRQRIFRPFHAAVEACLDQRQQAQRATRLVSIHSFTPVYHGVARPMHGGVLYLGAEAFAHETLRRLQSPDLALGLNAPYETSRTQDYAIPVHGDDRGIPAIMIEIRQDLIADDAGCDDWAARLYEAFR